MNDRKSSKLVTGCGIGCGVVVLILILAGVGLYTYIQHTIGNTEEIDKLADQLEAHYGTIEEYSPDPVYFIKQTSIERFIQVRDTLIGNSNEFIKTLDEMTTKIKTDDEDDKSFWDVMDMIGSGLDIVPGVFSYYYRRNELLLNAEMGMGEYTFLYITCYYSYLNKPLGDGPEFAINSSERNNHGSNDQEWKFGKDVLDEREAKIALKVSRYYKNFLKNFINSQSDYTHSEIISEVQEELEKLEDDKFRIPWRDGLPKEISYNLDLYKDKLENGYSELLNPFDFQEINE